MSKAFPPLFLLVEFLLIVSPALASRPLFRFTQGGRASLRSEESIPSEVLSRMEIGLIDGKKFKLVPFGEVRRDLDHDAWSRVELGWEVGWQLFPWVYVGEGLHQAWLSPGQNHPEWEVRTLFLAPFKFYPNGSRSLALYGLNEYTYDLRAGRGIRSEMGVGFKIPMPWAHLHTFLGWRHVDQIHLPDVDQFEGSLQAQF